MLVAEALNDHSTIPPGRDERWIISSRIPVSWSQYSVPLSAPLLLFVRVKTFTFLLEPR
jgi:hypothetical protein